MPHALFRQGLADLRSRGLQALHLFLITTAAAVTVTMAATTQRSASVLWDRIFGESNGAHATFMTRSAVVDLAAIGQLDGVMDQSGPHPVLRGLALMADPHKVPLTLYGVGREIPTVNRPVLKEGRWPDPGASDQIVLDPSYARDVPVAIGEQVEVRAAGPRVSLTVVGLALNAGAPYPPDAPAGYVAPSVLAVLEPDPLKREQAFSVRLADPSDSVGFIERVHARFPPGSFSDARDWQQTRGAVVFSNEINLISLRIASLFALLAVGMIVAISCSAFILARYRDIGLLKSIGFTPLQVTVLFMLEHLSLGLLGGVVGIALGTLLSPLLFASPFLQRAGGGLSAGSVLDADLGLLLGLLVGLELVVGIFTLVPSWSGGRISTVQAITVGPGQVHGRASFAARVAARLHLPLIAVLGVSDAFARPLRALVAILGLAMTISVTTLAFGVDGSLRAMLADPSVGGGPPASMLVQRGPYSDDATRRILDAHPEIRSYFGSLVVPALAVDRGVGMVTRAVGPRDASFRLNIVEGRMFSDPGETIVPQGLLDRLGLNMGDELRLVVQGRPLTLRIVGRLYSTANFGVTAFYGLESLHLQVDPVIEPTEYGLKLAPGTDTAGLQAALLRESANQFGIQATDLGEGNERIGATIFALSAALLLIGLINVFNTTLLGVQERVRDFGILKAIGMSPGQIVASVVSGMVALASLAAVLGIPVGFLLTQGLWTFATQQLGGGGGGLAPVEWAWPVVGVSVVALALAALGSALPARRAASLQVIEALRHE